MQNKVSPISGLTLCIRWSKSTLQSCCSLSCGVMHPGAEEQLSTVTVPSACFYELGADEALGSEFC